MRKVVIILIAVIILSVPVYAIEFTAPQAPSSVQKYIPETPESFWGDFFEIIKEILQDQKPDIAEAVTVCATLIIIVLVMSILSSYSDGSTSIVNLVSTLSISILLLNSSKSMIQLGVNTTREISEYGKLLLPVMTGAMAAQGGTATSTALYIGTSVFNTVLNAMGLKILIPSIYVYVVLCIAGKAIKQEILLKSTAFFKWLITWVLKIILYVFMGYIGITGIISGGVDASALKATKLAVSGLIPVVGSIISDASETILLSAGIMKNAVGIYGLLVIAAICIGPFLNIGLQYLLLKFTGGICSIFGNKGATDLIQDFSTALGFILAIISIMSLIFMVSTVCFMKGLSYG